MSREVHVPFCEGLAVKLRGSTHLTDLPGSVRGMFFYLYLILDLYSRKSVGWEVHAADNSDHASALVRRAVLAEGALAPPRVLHADNGSAQKGSTLLATLQALGIAPPTAARA